MRRLFAAVTALALGFPEDARAEPLRGDGPYGAVALSGSLEPFGSGNEIQIHCHELGAADCGTPIPLGFGFSGYAGVSRGPLGFEGFAAAFGDLHRPSAHYDGVPHTDHGNPLLSIPPRDETFIILRAGFLLVPRVRYTFDGTDSRASFAAGLGLAYRYSALEREVSGAGGVEDRPFFPSGVGYFSPALSLDGQWQLRVAATVAVVFGLGMHVESAGSGAKTDEDPTRFLKGDKAAFPIQTPPYALSSGLQFFLTPYVGIQFGP